MNQQTHQIVSGSKRIPRSARGLLAVLGLVAIATPAGASGARDRYDGELMEWQLSAGFEMGIYGTPARAEATGTPVIDGPGFRAPNIDPRFDEVDTVINDLRGANDLLSGVFGGSISLMTPSLLDVPTQPRLFLDVSLLPALTLESSIARDGDPGVFAIPDDAETQTAATFLGERLILGTGSTITSQHQGLQLHAGLGVAFTLDIADIHRVRIKPSLHYSRTENKVSALAQRAVRVAFEDPLVGRERPRSLSRYRLLALGDDFTEVYHAAGPALEFEYLSGERLGPFEVTIFVKAVATYIFGDRETEFFVNNPAPGLESEAVSFKYKNDPWAYMGTTGVRLRLVGFK